MSKFNNQFSMKGGSVYGDNDLEIEGSMGNYKAHG
jgi:hypothetical protein